MYRKWEHRLSFNVIKHLSLIVNFVRPKFVKMAFSFPAFSYIIALIVDAFLIFFSIFHVIAFDELKTDYKNPIDQCNSLNPVRILNVWSLTKVHGRTINYLNIFFFFQLVLPEYFLHLLINLLFLLSGEWFSLLINIPLILYHIHR